MTKDPSSNGFIQRTIILRIAWRSVLWGEDEMMNLLALEVDI